MFTHATAIAIEALIYMQISRVEEPVSPRFLASVLDESPTYMQKVLHRLVEAGILEARRGARGGVTFARPADQITLLDCMRACQDGPQSFSCALTGTNSKRCGMEQVLHRLDLLMTTYLNSVSIKTVAETPCPALGEDMTELCTFSSAHAAACRPCSVK